jgi:hypothetical protein
MKHPLLLACALVAIAGTADAQCVGALQANNNLSDLCSKSTALTNLGLGAANGMASLDGSGLVPVAQLPNAARASAVSVPFQGVPTTADPDVYAIPFSASIAASTVPSVICRVSPAASTTVVVKKWVAGSPATSSTLCTGTISTSCAISSCSISSTSLNAGDGLSVELTAASADTAARISVAVPLVKN